MYCVINLAFMPMSVQGSDSADKLGTRSRTALSIISRHLLGAIGVWPWYISTANTVWSPSVAGNQFVGKGETRKETALLQPVDRAESPAEKDSFNARKGDETGGKVLAALDPLHGPLALLLDTGNSVRARKVVKLFLLVLHILVDEEGIGLGMYTLHGILEGVEQASGRALGVRAGTGLRGSPDTIPSAAGEERQDLFNEILFGCGERDFQSLSSLEKSISSGVQKEATACL